jgi:predicted methyltransferase
MPRLTELAHDVVRAVLGRGDVAIDATAGNGHDTRFLAELVGPIGRVFAFDIQPEALDRTQEAVREFDTVTLLLRDHAELWGAIPDYYRGHVGAVMFNLGYRPGGDKSLTTRAETTTRAVVGALDVLRPGGVLTVVAYTGHAGGAEEADAVARLLNELPRGEFTVREGHGEAENAPRLFVVTKHPVGQNS